jgi:ribosomal protein S18 acetylase RimI-like enzyme
MEFFSIREYVSSDYPEVNNLWVAVGIGGAERGDDNSVILRTLALGGKLFVLLSADGKIIGTSWLSTDGRRTYIHHFAIAKAFQRAGLANKLLHHSLAHAKKEGLQVKLEVHRNNLAALNLYKKFKFTSLGDLEVLIIRNLNELDTILIS